MAARIEGRNQKAKGGGVAEKQGGKRDGAGAKREVAPSTADGREPRQKPKGKAKVASEGDIGFWQLRLYIAGQTHRSQSALRNLSEICEKHLKGLYTIEVVDLLVQPQLAAGDQIFAVPTLVRQLPPPVKKIIGDLSNVEKVLVGLDLRPVPFKGAR